MLFGSSKHSGSQQKESLVDCILLAAEICLVVVYRLKISLQPIPVINESVSNISIVKKYDLNLKLCSSSSYNQKRILDLAMGAAKGELSHLLVHHGNG